MRGIWRRLSGSSAFDFDLELRISVGRPEVSFFFVKFVSKSETMSFFSKVFGGKKEPAAPSTAEAIQKLRETEDMLIKKQEFLESKIDNEVLIAKKNASKNKRGNSCTLYSRFRFLQFNCQFDYSTCPFHLHSLPC